MERISSPEELYNRAWLLHKAGHYRDAIGFLENSLTIAEHYKSCELLAICYREIGEIEIAIEYLERAYKLNEKSSKTACLLAQHLLTVGEIYRSKIIVEKVLKNHHGYGPAIRILEQLAKLAGR